MTDNFTCGKQRRAQHRRGVLLILGAALCWSLSGLIVRNTLVANNWEIVFWRSLFSFLFLAGLLGFWHQSRVIAEIRAGGWPIVASGVLFATMMTFFIIAIALTTVANAQVISSIAPLVAALLAFVFLAERLALRTWVAILVASVGIAIMFAESLQLGGMTGNLAALVVPLAYGCNVVILRHAQVQADMMPSVLLGSLFSALATLPFAWPFSASLHDIALLAVMGSVQLGLGCVLFIRAARYIKAAELGLFGLLETLLAPLWVWLSVGEKPGELALWGALIVIGSLMANELLGLVSARFGLKRSAEST